MDKIRRESLQWFVVGLIFIAVSIHDVFFAGQTSKSAIIIVLEVIGAVCFSLVALKQWRKST